MSDKQMCPPCRQGDHAQHQLEVMDHVPCECSEAHAAKRLTGAALSARVVANCRRMLADDYGLPMDEYAVKEVDRYSLGSDMQPILTVTFARKGNGAEVQVKEIHPSDSGELDQYGSNYGRLAY